MSQTHQEFQRTVHFGSLDALRCLAIVGVLWHHSGFVDERPTLLTRGYLGVDLFFVLSGFLITTILLREIARTESISLRNFYVRRALRIFPLYFAFVIFLCVWVRWVNSNSAGAQGFYNALPYYVTYTSNWMPENSYEPIFARSWSLAVEEQFYLVWPTILAVISPSYAVWIAVGFILIQTGADLGMLGDDVIVVGQKLAPFSAISLGVILAIILDQPTGYAALKRPLGRRYSVIACLAAVVALISMPGPIVGAHRLLVYFSMAGLVASVVTCQDHILSAPFQCRPVVHIGIVSYGIYILHSQCFGMCDRLLALAGWTRENTPVATYHLLLFLTLVGVSTLAATISYRYLESPFLKLKKRFSSRPART